MGSYAFVRAFEEPPVTPYFAGTKHFGSDELLGAWLFLLGTVPFVPYALLYWSLDPGNVIYLGMVFISIVMVAACYLFVLGCYPTNKRYKNALKPVLRILFGRSHWVLKHLQNDWLAGTWFFYYATLVALVGSFGIFWESLASNNALEQFIYALGFADCLMFLIGCMYFVSGSYPLDMYQVYRKRIRANSEDEPAQAVKEHGGGHGHGHGAHHEKKVRSQLVEKLELKFHPHALRSHYEDESTENIGDAVNPMHQFA